MEDKNLREKCKQQGLVDPVETIQEYIDKSDWRINANANQGYSIGGMILNAAGKMTANYWLEKVYGKEIGDKHRNGDYHIHDLDFLGGYCAGWSLRQLLQEGFNGVPNKVSSKPPKHFGSALGQMVNFLGTLQNEWAGAQAFSSFDTYLAPYVYKDKLSYKEIKQEIQQFVFNLNVPSRWGCVPLDTEILTKDGWKKYNEINIGDKIYSYNPETKETIEDEINKINLYDFDDELISLSNRSQEQLLTPNHRVLRRIFNSNEFQINYAEDVFNMKTPIDVPISSHTPLQEYDILDEELKLYAWILSDGSIPLKGRKENRIIICQSEIKNEKYCREIENILNKLNITFNVKKSNGGLGEGCNNYKLSRPRSVEIANIIEKKKLPMNILRKCSERQIKLFIDTYRKGNGCKDRFRITTVDEEIKDNLQELAFLCGYGTNTRLHRSNLSGNLLYNISFLTKGKDVLSLTKKEKFKYKGQVWCPTTNSSLWVARRNGSVFITGNSQSPFSNLTFDWTVPDDLKDKLPMIGSDLLLKDEPKLTYNDFKKEMSMINRAFLEVMVEGDSEGRIFSFPIPTYNITEDFEWDGENTNLLFEVTAKYGLPYFQNFIGSQYKRDENGKLVEDEKAYKPGAVRSMCPLTSDTEVVIKNSFNEIYNLKIGEMYKNFQQANNNYKIFYKGEWFDSKPVLVEKTDVYQIKFNNGIIVKMGENHLQPTLNDGVLSAKDLKVGMFCPFNKHEIKNDEDLILKPKFEKDFKEDENYNYYKIDSIKKITYNGDLYCLEAYNDEQLFTLSNGLITHNCRLQLDLSELLKKGGGLFGSAEMTGSVGVVTINTARLGYKFKGNKEGLYKELEYLMDLSKQSLELKRKTVLELMDRNMYPFTKRYLGHLRSHFSTIGINGLNEMIRNFTNDEYDISTKEGIEFAKEFLNFMRNKMVEFQNQTGNLYNLEATPAEGTTYRFAKEDKKRFGVDIIQAGTPENNYYTNSSQLPAGFTNDPFEAVELQDDLQKKYTGGTVLHFYIGERFSSSEVCKKFIKNILSNNRLPYITISPTFSICENHGYLKGEVSECPICKSKTEIWTRVMGYHRPVSQFNIGKKGEYNERVCFKE